MPVDPESLAAFGDLASRRGPDAPTDPPASDLAPASVPDRDPLALLRAMDPGTRQRVLALGAGSVLAGLVCGLLVPATAEAESPSVPRPASHADLATFHEASATALPFTGVGPMRPSGSLPPSGPASTGRVSAVRVAALAAGDAEPAGSHLHVAPTAAAPVWRLTRPLPAASGTGRRIVYAERAAHLWIVAADGTVLRDYKVTGRIDRPRAGSYRVWSKSERTSNPKERLTFDLMVRFARGYTGAPIGFHTIPRTYAGTPIQSESQLGTAVGRGGCVRQSRIDAEWLYHWVRVGDTVVVLR